MYWAIVLCRWVMCYSTGPSQAASIASMSSVYNQLPSGCRQAIYQLSRGGPIRWSPPVLGGGRGSQPVYLLQRGGRIGQPIWKLSRRLFVSTLLPHEPRHMCAIIPLIFKFGHKIWPIIVCGWQNSSEVLNWNFNAQGLAVCQEDYLHSNLTNLCSKPEIIFFYPLGERTFLCWGGKISRRPTGRILFVLSSYPCHSCWFCEIFVFLSM